MDGVCQKSQYFRRIFYTLQWRHNEPNGVSNHRLYECLLSRLFRPRSKKTSKLRITGLCEVNFPHKWPVTRKMLPFDDIIMIRPVSCLRSALFSDVFWWEVSVLWTSILDLSFIYSLGAGMMAIPDVWMPGFGCHGEVFKSFAIK